MKTLVLLIAAMVVLVTVVEAAPPKPEPYRSHWMIAETKTDYGIGRTGLPEYSITGKLLSGQRWSIFTYSTVDFENISLGLVYRCKSGKAGSRWCAEGMIVQMLSLIHI